MSILSHPRLALFLISAAAPLLVSAQTVKPTISAIKNVASYGSGSVAPGEMVLIGGTGMGPTDLAGLQLDTNGHVATMLSGVQVLFDGTAAPLVYVSQTLISAMTPFGVKGQSTTKVQVVYQGIVSDPFIEPVSDVFPAIFSANASGSGQAAMTNSDGTYNSSTNPAVPGSFVTFYMTGVGPTDPSGDDGSVSAGIAYLTTPTIVKIAGTTAQILYAGAAPASVNGFTQFNVVVPSTLPYGGNLPLTVEILNTTSQSQITLAVAGPTAPVADAPTNLSATVSSGKIFLAWSATNALASKFHIERSIPGSPFEEIATAPGASRNFTDPNVTPGTQYTYRILAESTYGFSAYSQSVTAMVPVVQSPPAPSMQSTVLSSSQVGLSWTNAAPAVLRFHLERRSMGASYAEIAQPGSSATSFTDTGLTASSTYFYRIRVETDFGVSPYSTEVSATTFQGLPAAPSNLQVSDVNYNHVNLSWINNAADATAVRVESAPAGSAMFTDIGAAATLTSTGISNLQQSTSYTFRVRAQNAVGFSPYSNVATVTTASVPKTIFLIHGIRQGFQDMRGLFGSLTGPLGVSPSRFIVDYGFDFSECANVDFCPANCSITGGAQKLAQYIINTKPPGDIVLIGFSMGGLIARDMMANNWFGVLNGRKVAALVTLGTPNLGYPYTFVDRSLMCTPLIQAMDGNWRSQQAQNTVVLSPYLSGLTTQQWPPFGFPGSTGRWLAASGRSCSNAIRIFDSTTGCRDSNPYSDGVVCNDSAVYNIRTVSGTSPVYYWQDPGQIYVHSNGVGGLTGVLCNNSGDPTLNPPLSNPPSFGPLFSAIMGVLNGL